MYHYRYHVCRSSSARIPAIYQDRILPVLVPTSSPPTERAPPALHHHDNKPSRHRHPHYHPPHFALTRSDVDSEIPTGLMMMAPVQALPLRNSSLVDLSQTPEASAVASGQIKYDERIEYNDQDYIRDVLQLSDHQTEALVHAILVLEAENLGITTTRPESARDGFALSSLSESDFSNHTKTGSWDSQETQSSRSSYEQVDNAEGFSQEQRPSSRRSLSFSEYGKYLEQTGETDNTQRFSISIMPPAEREGSLFSVSTRKSYTSIKNGIKKSSRSLFRLRRGSTCSQSTK